MVFFKSASRRDCDSMELESFFVKLMSKNSISAHDVSVQLCQFSASRDLRASDAGLKGGCEQVHSSSIFYFL
jgi:hypothetical protein